MPAGPSGQRERGTTIEHAVVLGGSMAGLTAAAALATRAERVTIVDRDDLRGGGEPRKGVPQGRHVHVFMPGGLRALRALLPGIDDAFQAAGAYLNDRGYHHRLHVGGGAVRLDAFEPSAALIGASRPLLERVVRERVEALGRVRLRGGCEASGLVLGAGGRAVEGVRVRARGSREEDVVRADVVVDATGRGSRAPRWLSSAGYPAPTEERVQLDVRYTTRAFRREGDGPGGARGVLVTALPGNPRAGMALAVEGGRWLVAVTRLLGEQLPTDLDGFLAFARSLWSSDVYAIASSCEALGEAVTGAFPANVRRRYDRLRRFPAGFVVVGDGLCALNPSYARGMSMAARQAGALGETLDRPGPERLGPAFFRAARTFLTESWRFVVDNDLEHPRVDGPRTLRWRLARAYTRRVLPAAHADPVVGMAFADVVGMRATVRSLLRPPIAWRVLTRRYGAPSRAVRAGASGTSTSERV